MDRRVRLLLMVLVTLLVSSVGARCRRPPPPSGTFSFVTYNVAGLPDFLSGQTPPPSVTTPQISPLLNGFDAVVVQEDFAHHAALISQLTFPFLSNAIGDGSFLNLGDGLNRFSIFAFNANLFRETWTDCNGTFGSGSDCLGSKGFSFETLEIHPGIFLHVYNLHMDAGSDPGDLAARQAQAVQLMAAMDQISPGEAVIVAGDFNLDRNRQNGGGDAALLDQILADEGLEDACLVLGCPYDAPPGASGILDHVMYRSGTGLSLTAVTYVFDPDPPGFYDPSGLPLSDHAPVEVGFAWIAPN